MYVWGRKQLSQKNEWKPGQICITILTWAFPFVRLSVFHSGVLDELECAKEGTLSICSRPLCIFPRKKTACFFMSHLCNLCSDLHGCEWILIISAGKKDKQPQKWVNLFPGSTNRRCCELCMLTKKCTWSRRRRFKKVLLFLKRATRPQDVFTSTPFINNAFSIFHIQTSIADKLVKQMEIQLLQLDWRGKLHYIRKDFSKES